MTVFDLEQMELCYAPQFGSAKDAVNMAGFVAAGLLRGDHPQADMATALDGPPDDRTILLDVRTPKEHAEGHLPGAVNIPVESSDFRDRVSALDPAGTYAVYCRSGNRSQGAVETMAGAGITGIYELESGTVGWTGEGLDLVR